MKKAEKIFFVENLAAELKAASSVVLVNYTGLSVKSQQELKKRLKEVGAKMLVVKNTLLKRAGSQAEIDPQVLEDSVLTGQTALILTGDDPIAAIGVLGRFAKEKEVPQMKVGIIEDVFQDSEALAKLSALPGRDVLLGQLLATLMSPSFGLVRTLKGNIQKLVSVLTAQAESKVKAG